MRTWSTVPMAATALIALVLLITTGTAAAQEICLAPHTTGPAKSPFVGSYDCWEYSTDPSVIDYNDGATLTIPVAFHIVHDGLEGNIPDASVYELMNLLNAGFSGNQCPPSDPCIDPDISFELLSINRYDREDLFVLVPFSETETTLKSEYACSPLTVLNIFSADLRWPDIYGNNLLGVGSFPWRDYGTDLDGVMIDYSTTLSFPGDRKEIIVHEVGHYLGLYHPFETYFGLGCDDWEAPDCYSNGDLICDTNPSDRPLWDCPGFDPWTCGTPSRPDDKHNFMSYFNDYCTYRFQPEQVGRMRCALQTWRPLLGEFTVLEASGTYTPSSGYTTYKFEWVTSEWSDPADDRVLLSKLSGRGCPLPGDGDLKLGEPYVSVTVEPLGNCLYKHTLRWTVLCTKPCYYMFRTESSVDGEVARSESLPLYVLSCAEIHQQKVPGLSVSKQGVTLHAPSPNPFNPSVTIRFSLETAQSVSLEVFNLRGQRVAVLDQSDRAAGEHSATWNGRDTAGEVAASGSYVFVMRTAEGSLNQMGLLLK